MRERTGNWTSLSTRYRNTALRVPSRVNVSNTSRTTVRACSSGSNTTSPAPAQAEAETPEATEAAATQPPPLIEREVLFGNPERYQGRLSPDGSKMSFRAPLDGVMNIWVGERGNFDSVRPIPD
mgnify:CR=1 FL=1